MYIHRLSLNSDLRPGHCRASPSNSNSLVVAMLILRIQWLDRLTGKTIPSDSPILPRFILLDPPIPSHKSPPASPGRLRCETCMAGSKLTWLPNGYGLTRHEVCLCPVCLAISRTRANSTCAPRQSVSALPGPRRRGRQFNQCDLRCQTERHPG